MVNRVIAIGDVHASDYWKEIVKLRQPGDKVVFLGDYFDRRGGRKTSFAPDEGGNFLQICDYARNDPDVTLLVGNHDFEYTPWDEYGTNSVNEFMYKTYSGLIMKNLDLMQMVRIYNINGRPTLFSHAGVSKAFLKLCGCSQPEELNWVWREHPEEFAFKFIPPRGFEGEYVDGHGDNVFQSPIWIRPDALAEDAVRGYDQVVGHTQWPDPQTPLEMENGRELHIVCTFGPDNYLVCQ